MREEIKNALAILLLIAFFNACVPFTDSPFSDQLQHPDRVLNENAISELPAIEDDGLLRFAVYSDSHQNYVELRQMITMINDEPQLDFVVGLGDFTNSSYNFEYDEYIRSVLSIRYPAVTVIGNHDSIGAGPELFQRAFGSVNFFFESAAFRFIFFNSNNIENQRDFSAQWLKDRIDETAKNTLIFTHISLRDDERYTNTDAAIFSSVIADTKVKAVFNGHDHVFTQATDNGTIMIQSARVASTSGVHWLVVTIQTGQLCVLRKDTGESTCQLLK